MPVPVRRLVATLISAIFICGAAFSQESQTVRDSNSETPAASGGLRAYLDPATGRLIDHPPYGKPTLELSRKELYMFSTDDWRLIERELPDGGYALDLQGRFRQGTVATLNEEGDVELHRIGGEIFLSPTGERVRPQVIQQESTSDGGGP